MIRAGAFVAADGMAIAGKFKRRQRVWRPPQVAGTELRFGSADKLTIQRRFRKRSSVRFAHMRCRLLKFPEVDRPSGQNKPSSTLSNNSKKKTDEGA